MFDCSITVHQSSSMINLGSKCPGPARPSLGYNYIPWPLSYCLSVLHIQLSYKYVPYFISGETLGLSEQTNSCEDTSAI